jgi:hypothetical protein
VGRDAVRVGRAARDQRDAEPWAPDHDAADDVGTDDDRGHEHSANDDHDTHDRPDDPADHRHDSHHDADDNDDSDHQHADHDPDHRRDRHDDYPYGDVVSR